MIQGRTFSNLEQVSVRYIGPVRDLGYLEQVQIFSGKKFIYFVRIGWKKGEKKGGGGDRGFVSCLHSCLKLQCKDYINELKLMFIVLALCGKFGRAFL